MGDGLADKPGTIENIGYAADLAEVEGLENASRILKTTPEQLRKQIEDFKIKLSQHTPDTISLED